MTSEYESAAAVTARAPAKVNLQLAVGPARPDGFHSLVTVYHAVSLFDEVTVSPSTRTSIKVRGEDAATVPADHTNLAWQAALALAAAAGLADRDAAVHIDIRKRIPAAAGLAGGSADAAATLVACNELWRTGLTGAELAEIGARLGSDVPFTLAGGTAVGRGRGEELTTALVSGAYHWALAFSHTGLSTPEVYATCDRLRAARAVDPSTGDSTTGGAGGSSTGGSHGSSTGGSSTGGSSTGGSTHGRLRQGHRRVRPVRRATAQHRADDGAAVRRRHRRRAAAV